MRKGGRFIHDPVNGIFIWAGMCLAKERNRVPEVTEPAVIQRLVGKEWLVRDLIWELLLICWKMLLVFTAFTLSMFMYSLHSASVCFQECVFV